MYTDAYLKPGLAKQLFNLDVVGSKASGKKIPRTLPLRRSVEGQAQHLKICGLGSLNHKP